MIPVLAPLVASLAKAGLGLIGNAVLAKGKEVVEEKLGVSLDTAVQTPEGLVRLKELEIQHEEALNAFVLAQREQELKAAEMTYADTAGARGMSTKVNETPHSSWLTKNIAAILALIVVVGGGCALVSTKDADVRTAAVGLMTLVLGFYFGSTVRSAGRDELIAKLAAPK